MKRQKQTSLFESNQVKEALKQSFVKLNPKILFRNPIMFLVEVGAAVMLIVCIWILIGEKNQGSFVYNFIVFWVLFITVLFANFAEAIAEARGKAQADSLRKTREETKAKLVVNNTTGFELKLIDTISSQLKKGDIFFCETGDTIPTDGEIIEGIATIDESVTPFKELDSAKTNFIATVSHELKTPIAAIKMSLQLLQNEKSGTLNSDQKQLVESIADDSNRLLKITGELLNMAQVETGNIQLTFNKVTPKHIIELATEAVHTLAEQKQIQLDISIPDNMPYVNADLDKTVWVLVNLLANAIRYSSEQSKIQIEAKEYEKQIQFSVKDSGTGIEEKYLPKVFERYFKVPGSKGGTGLGLAISKEFIEAQGGKITVESETGRGSKFAFFLNS